MSTAIFVSLLPLISVSNCVQTFLVASETGVKTLSGQVPPFATIATTTTTTVHNGSASAIHFRYEKDVYFISGNQILYSYYSVDASDYATGVPSLSLANSLTDLVVDWLQYRLYFTDGTGVLYRSALLGSSPTQLYKATQLRDLAVDPYDRLLFFIEEGALMSLGLDSLESYRYTLGSSPLSRVASVAVDLHSREVYAVGYNSIDQWHLVATDYQDKHSRLVFNGPELAGVVALDVCDGQVAWARSSDDRYTLYTCRLSPHCDIDDLNVLSQSNEIIYDVKFFSPLAQTPSEEVACRLLNCSHNCAVVSIYSVRCECPEGMMVKADENECRAIFPPPFERSPLSGPLIVVDLLLIASEALYLWFTSSVSPARTLILICCVVMAGLALGGLCLLMATWTPTRPPRSNKSYRLSERYNMPPSRHSYRSKTVHRSP